MEWVWWLDEVGVVIGWSGCGGWVEWAWWLDGVGVVIG